MTEKGKGNLKDWRHPPMTTSFTAFNQGLKGCFWLVRCLCCGRCFSPQNTAPFIEIRRKIYPFVPSQNNHCTAQVWWNPSFSNPLGRLAKSVQVGPNLHGRWWGVRNPPPPPPLCGQGGEQPSLGWSHLHCNDWDDLAIWSKHNSHNFMQVHPKPKVQDSESTVPQGLGTKAMPWTLN